MNFSIVRVMWGSALVVVALAIGLSVWVSTEIGALDEIDQRSAQLSEAPRNGPLSRGRTFRTSTVP